MTLRVNAFYDGLDNQRARVERIKAVGRLKGVAGRRGLETTFLDLALNGVLHVDLGPGQRARIIVDENDGVAVSKGDLGNPGTHGASAENPNHVHRPRNAGARFS